VQDEVYVQLTFLMSMDKYGIDAPAKKFQEMFAKPDILLWHANMQARKNYMTVSCTALREVLNIVFMQMTLTFRLKLTTLDYVPGMPNTGSFHAEKIGHI